MNWYLKVCCLLLIGASNFVFGQAPTQNISVHDPVMARQDSTYYIFATGNGIAVWSSTDRLNWKREKSVFAEAPQWATQAIPGFKGHIWAPDISFYKGRYYLYYSVSAFGKNTSAIGVASNKTLDPSAPDFKWIDHGKVIQSYPDLTNWNAIDPNLITGAGGKPYLAFGSFWNGLQLIRLSKDRLSVIGDTIQLQTIASRKTNPLQKENPPAIDNNPVNAGGNAIEAPFIFKKGKYYYLFASIDYCCKGENSTYKMIVGRAKKLTGLYVDKQGKPLKSGGGSILLQGNKDWNGVGHNSVYTFDGQEYLVFHAYDAHDKGKPKLRIEALDWPKGWPEVKSKN